ncbi:MAG: CBS domain-containing protein [Planctomycetota bacterium]|nr:CBS domain-containing protein [Planctomycetota bacterium]
MTCASIMTTDLVTVSPDTTVGDTIRLLTERRFRSIPVVDKAGTLLGQFGVQGVLGLSMPRVAGMGLRGSMSNISFVHDNMSDIRRRLADNLEDPVGNYVSGEFITLKPKDDLTHVVQSLYQSRGNMPVVDPDSGKLVGIVSYWDALEHIFDDLDT